MSNSQQRLVLGIDGGATKTVALLGDADTGAIVGRSRQRGSNFYAHDSSAAFAELDRAIAQAFVDAGIPRQKVEAMCAGIAGVSRPEDEQMVSSWVRNRGIADDLLIANDGWLVIAAGTADGVGIGVICGTGSIAVGRDAQGHMRRAGGWGYLFGDEGSGHDLAIMALRAAACAADGRGPRTALLPALLNHWQLQLPEDFITYLYGVSDPRPLLGDVGPVVMQVAAEHDAVALQIVQQAGFELARSVMAVSKHLELPRPLPLALAGSMIVRGEPLQRALADQLSKNGISASIQLVEDPAVGALRLAQRIAIGERHLKSEWQAF
jgi:N-acetylglucosamine kinase-like BadF-type ATPase